MEKASFSNWKNSIFPGGYDPRRDPGDCYPNQKAGDDVIEFFETMLTLNQGESAGSPFVLEEWQRNLLGTLFGWKRSDGTRRYREAYIEVGRKNGKSALCAGIALFCLYADGERGAEVMCCAVDRDQASIVYDFARNMVEANPDLAKRSEVFRKEIRYTKGKSRFSVLSADVENKHGSNPSCIVVDELHAFGTRDLLDVLQTATGSRKQPLTVVITTAGWDRNSICWEKHEYARKVAAGLISDTAFLPVIYAASDGDDFKDPEVWKKANPNLGVSLREEFLIRECSRAVEVPAYENTFRRLHLCQWTETESKFISMDSWDACDLRPVSEETLRGRRCFAGLDLSTTTDLSAFVLVFPPLELDGPFDVLPFFWIPENNLHKRVRQDRVPYDLWAKQGFIRPTPGDVIDYAYILQTIGECSKKFDIAELAFDRWGSTKIMQDLQEMGFEGKDAKNPKRRLVDFGQGFASMSGAVREFLRLLLSKKLNHGGNPVLRWMASNVVMDSDPANNLKPNKAKSTERIDGIVSLLMAIDRAVSVPVKKRSKYETQGLKFI